MRGLSLVVIGLSVCVVAQGQNVSDSYGGTREYFVLPMELNSKISGVCSNTDSSEQIIPSGPWVGMVTLNGCSLSKKQETLQRMGASGMLIQSDIASYDIFSSYKNNFYVIPVTQEMYKMLSNIYLAKNPPNTKEYQYPTIKVDLPLKRPIPFLQLIYIIFLILMIFVFPLLFERLEEKQAKLVRPKDLASLSLQHFSRLQEKDKKHDQCSICFDKFTKVSLIRTLYCRHYFHSECIDPWLLSRSSRCPVCNQEMLF
ncbi:E3 ubiquitin-protein ligase RNF13 [Nematocida sp. AWRm80]|nr:E3 ubiquitin-protein ligase RNF13 [Nematocida sp. AWRm80]